MVAMLLPCTYSMAAQNWPSISPAPKTLVMFGLLKTLVRLGLGQQRLFAARQRCSPNALNWIALRAIV